jgi:hypothetical protein
MFSVCSVCVGRQVMISCKQIESVKVGVSVQTHVLTGSRSNVNIRLNMVIGINKGATSARKASDRRAPVPSKLRVRIRKRILVVKRNVQPRFSYENNFEFSRIHPVVYNSIISMNNTV